MPTLVHRIVLAGRESEVPLVRRDIIERVRAWGVPLDEETADAIRLVASELIANAVIHGSGPITVALYHTTGRLVIDVLDGSAAAPRVGSGGANAESGRGLSLVGLLALSWAWEPTDRGKRVWAELAVPAPVSAARAGVPHVLPAARAGRRPGVVPELFTSAVADGRHAVRPGSAPGRDVVYRPSRRDVDPVTGEPEPAAGALWDRHEWQVRGEWPGGHRGHVDRPRAFKRHARGAVRLPRVSVPAGPARSGDQHPPGCGRPAAARPHRRALGGRRVRHLGFTQPGYRRPTEFRLS